MSTFLRGLIPATSADQVVGKRVYLRPPELRDWESWARLRAESREFLVPWEPTWPRDVLTQASYRQRLRRYAEESRNDRGYAFFVLRKDDDAIVGGLNLSHVHRGVTQSSSLGYWVGKRFARNGYISDAVQAIIGYVFDGLGLHRLEAACVPTNEASRRLLTKVGFTQEGYAREYLRINGEWRDHLLFSYLSTDPRPE
ncbi:MAG: GNAT family protein [Rhodospirillaceae bacterium]|nr:GNAT family protein [Rhodospirillaceae bacterium]